MICPICAKSLLVLGLDMGGSMPGFKSWSLLLLAGWICGGCVTGHRVIDLKVPAGTPAAARGQVSIVTVVDHRKFENSPAEPSTPSIDGDVTKMTAEQLTSYIGRQRNMYGKAMGDVKLPDGQTVVLKAKALVTEGFARRGYSPSPNGTPVEVEITEFWTWFTPGFWYVGFDARVQCRVTIRGARPATLVITGYESHGGQVESDENLQQAYDLAFESFLKNMDEQLQKAGY
jgi:hypothetical protein